MIRCRIIAIAAFLTLLSIARSALGYDLKILQVRALPGSAQAIFTFANLDAKPIHGLSAPNVSAKVDGAVVPIKRLQPASDGVDGISIVLAIDCSGSMAGASMTEADRKSVV